MQPHLLSSETHYVTADTEPTTAMINEFIQNELADVSMAMANLKGKYQLETDNNDVPTGKVPLAIKVSTHLVSSAPKELPRRQHQVMEGLRGGPLFIFIYS